MSGRAEMGLTPLDEVGETACNRRDALTRAAIEARATSYEGVAVKARVMRDDSDAGATDFTPKFLASIITDLERLAARA